ncbi:MAG: DUF4388 domain-containing protein [Kouleothrix sp.]|nr:DUF4388 domain-containing protein [Kouleothrix sp.]
MALQGDLGDFPLTDIIQLLDLSNKTGAVFIEGHRGQQDLEGWLYFRDGKIIGAQLGKLPPLEAAYTFFTFTSGPFRFRDDIQLDAPTITQSNEMIIMEGVMRQDAWAKIQEHVPSLNMVPQLVTNPASTGTEINLEADEWRVLTMVNAKNTVAQIAQRSGLGEVRACEIIAQLLASGLIQKRQVSLAETLFPELDRIATAALGASARALLHDSYGRAAIEDQNTATPDQVALALEAFESAATRAFGQSRVAQLLADLRAVTRQVFSSM